VWDGKREGNGDSEDIKRTEGTVWDQKLDPYWGAGIRIWLARGGGKQV
jgi:hypothetical protein